MKIFNNIILLVFVLINGCADVRQTDEELNNLELLRILDEDAAAGMDGFDDGGLISLEYERGLEIIGSGRITDDTLSSVEGYRIRFGRQIIDRERTVDFTIDGDTAIGVVSYLISGIFMAEAKDTSTLETVDSIGFSKSFTSAMTRKVKYKKVDNNNPEGYSWKIIALTPLYGGAGDKVAIASIDIYELNFSEDDSVGVTNGEEGDLVLSVSTDDISNLFMDRENLPTFNSFEHYIVKTTVYNDGPEYALDSIGVGEWVMQRYGRSANYRGRRRLNDLGNGADAIINDNIHTKAFRMHGPGIGRSSRVFRTFYSTTDLATLFTEDGGYNSVTLSIPYVSQRAE